MKKTSTRKEPKEHPEDKALREQSEALAAEAINAFAEKHRAKLVRLIQVYADAKAHEQLDELREKFWSSLDYGP